MTNERLFSISAVWFVYCFTLNLVPEQNKFVTVKYVFKRFPPLLNSTLIACIHHSCRSLCVNLYYVFLYSVISELLNTPLLLYASVHIHMQSCATLLLYIYMQSWTPLHMCLCTYVLLYFGTSVILNCCTSKLPYSRMTSKNSLIWKNVDDDTIN